MMLLMGMSMTAAASTNVYLEKYCGVCGATLVQRGSHVANYMDDHTYYYVVDGNRVEATCDVAHSIADVYGYCPTHGLRWRATEHTEVHYAPRCPYYGTMVYCE